MQKKQIKESGEKILSTAFMSSSRVNKCLSIVLHSYIRKVQKYPKDIHLFQNDDCLQIVDAEGIPLFSFSDKASVREIHSLLIEFQRVPFVLAFHKLYQMVTDGYESHNRICLALLLDQHQSHIFPWPWKISWDRKKIFCAESSLLFSLPESTNCNNCFDQGVLEDIIALKASSNPQEYSGFHQSRLTDLGSREVVIY